MSVEYRGNEVVFDNKYFTLHKFNTGANPPIFVVPPFAGRKGTVTQNLINCCVSQGRTVYAYELKSATHQTKDLSVSGLVNILGKCLDIIGAEQVDIAACCQGGWLSSIFTALHPERVRKLALFAAPINTRTGCGNRIEEYCSSISMPTHRFIVGAHGGIQPGLFQWLAFAAMAPTQIFYGRYIDLYSHIVNGRLDAVKKWESVNNWYDSPNNLAGVWFLDALENHFSKNKLYNGTWTVCDKIVDLSKITCPVFVFAGEDDDITSSEQARGILDKVSSTEKHFINFPGAGHTRVFTGQKELSIFSSMFF